MTSFNCKRAAIAVALSCASVVQAATLSFEDLNPSPASYDLMPSTYNGFNFTGWFFGPDTLYTPGSGVIDLFTDYADPSDPFAYVVTNSNNQISSSTAFVFDGATFSGYSGATFELWFGGSLVHTSTTLPDSPDANPYLPTFLASGYGGLVDKVVVSAVQGYYSMDDFTFQVASSSVPEPSTIALVMLSLLGIGMTPKKRWD